MNEYAPPVMNNFFYIYRKYRQFKNFQIILDENKKIVRYGSDIIPYRTPLLWANLSEEYKLANSLSEFKSKKSLEMWYIVCQLYRPFLHNLGFI